MPKEKTLSVPKYIRDFSTAQEISDRIKEFKFVRLGDINHNPHNWKIHTQGGRDKLE